ncbi:MAG: hypothetical protein M9939_24260 [Mesorhizobium sp.]|nr:hypothetical protein [Mesorhizobium sp.]MCO5164217.1 hypothetical protein [Mesorhizobium sp.]
MLTINGGSSSIKFVVFETGAATIRRLHGKIDRIDGRETTLSFTDLAGGEKESQPIGEMDHRAAASFLLDWLDRRIGLASLKAIGHRVVNGGARYKAPQPVTNELMDELRRISAYAPEHLPSEIGLIELFSARAPMLAQVACFDTAFHQNMLRVAKILPIPRRYGALGVERLGFHCVPPNVGSTDCRTRLPWRCAWRWRLRSQLACWRCNRDRSSAWLRTPRPCRRKLLRRRGPPWCCVWHRS